MAQSYLNKQKDSDIAFIAEHRHKDKAVLQAKLAKAGWKAAMEMATDGPSGGASGGTCVAWRPHLQAEEIEVPLAEVGRGRLAFLTVQLKKDIKILMVAIYGYVGIGYNGDKQ